jgi:carboxylesterase
LPGHGSDCKSFIKNNRFDQFNYVKEYFLKIKENHKRIYLIGHSMGGLFCLKLAEKHKIDGIVLISTPMRINLRKLE